HRLAKLATSGDCRGQFDPGRIAQLLGNLLSNASRHGAEDGAVTVACAQHPAGVQLSVHNVGEPIPPEEMPKLFAPVKSAHGLGLGLYVVNEIARAQGGRVEVQSSHAHGTTVRVWLPKAGGLRN